MENKELEKIVQDLLTRLWREKTLEPLKQLFWSELNYEKVNQPLARRNWSKTAYNALIEDPIIFACAGKDKDFSIIYSRLNSDRLLLGMERPVISTLLREHPYALFIFSNKKMDHWHFVNVKWEEGLKDESVENKVLRRRLFRRITIGPDEKLRTASDRVAMLDINSISPDLFGYSALTIQVRHDEAFDVEQVTEKFFEEYKEFFKQFKSYLYNQVKDQQWAHDYALQFLNRLMFLYFLQRKRWLGNDNEFIRHFWEAYKDSGQPKDTFFDKWLRVLFFEAFNKKYHCGHRHFPEGIQDALSNAPFLNGGLFSENKLDWKRFNISDEQFEKHFKFLDSYNFTISEDTPFDKEVAVDPEMIGKVYESLVSVSEELDEGGEAGIFYTPTTEIDLMCRLSLVDWFANHLGNEHKNRLYEAVFAFSDEEKEKADKNLAEYDLWPRINKLLNEITVLDPACGSGSFLVGMLYVLDDLMKRANSQLGVSETAFKRRSRLIAQSLYGVDVMDWAVHIAELRLWLHLIVESEDAEIPPEERRLYPLLPNLSFKIRQGDSLVQKIGGINLAHIKRDQTIPASLKGRITRLKAEKRKYFNNEPDREIKTKEDIEKEELLLFREILETRIRSLEEDIKKKRRDMDTKPVQQTMKGIKEAPGQQLKLEQAKIQKEIEEKTREIEQLKEQLNALKSVKNVPFVWDIAFVEIFESDKKGFDIVIGNPPYVRQENIQDPQLTREQKAKMTPAQLRESKDKYKNALIHSVYELYPEFFGYEHSTGTVSHKIDAKSDLYIYFYLKGLSLLNPKGNFCFITSNSWLDVGYGKDLQEFLLKNVKIKMIIDNKVKRSFKQADVNTIIALFSAPLDKKELTLAKENIARFVMFTAPFEQVMHPVIFEEIEEANKRIVTKEYKLFPISQQKLLEDGLEMPEPAEETKTKKHIGVLIKSAKYIWK